jgi:hypothetical protein
LNGRIPAGNQSLVPIMAVRLSRPAHLIDIKAVGGLDVLAVCDETMRRLFASAAAMLSAFGGILGFIIGTVLLVPLGLALESIGPHGPDAGGGAMAALLLWYLGAALFLLFKAEALGDRRSGAPGLGIATADWGDRLLRESGSPGSATLSAHLTRSRAARSEAASTSRRYGFSTG